MAWGNSGQPGEGDVEITSHCPFVKLSLQPECDPMTTIPIAPDAEFHFLPPAESLSWDSMTGNINTDHARIEPAALEDLPQLVELLIALFSEEADFAPNRDKQEHGLRLILEQPNRGRIFVLRTDHQVVGMVNLLFTISTAEGGLVVLMEDIVVHPQHRRQGFGSLLLEHAINFAQERGFRRITLLTDKISAESQDFFQRHGFSFSTMIPMRLVFNR